MPETLNLSVRGLYTSPNQFSAVPPGSLNMALNCVIDRPNIAQSRRGQFSYWTVTDVVDKMFNYRTELLAHYGTTMAYDSNHDGIGTEYSGTFSQPDSGYRIQSIESNQNFYITTSSGILKLDAIDSEFVAAGSPKGLSGTYTLTNPGFMSDDVNVAYRMVWGYTDANENEIVGAPSQRMIASNDSGFTADVVQTWLIPDEVTTSYFYRVYRSGESADLDSEPNDELQLVKEGNPTSGEISAGTLTFTDNVPNSLRGATLYTSPSQEGISQANDQPPFAKDMTIFRGYVFYANTKSKQRYFVTLLSVGDNTLGGSLGYQTNNGTTTDTLTSITGLTKAATLVVQDLTYTADAAGVAGNDISIEYTGGGTAGAEVVTVTGTFISVRIQSGVSTATQVKAAVDASVPASALISVAITGAGANPQVTAAQTFLADGFDTTYLNVGMRVVATGVPANSRIVSIDSISAITISAAATASATVAMEFNDIFRINSLEYFADTATHVGNKEFKVFLDGTPAENIQNTAFELISVINQDTANTVVYAYYLSGFEDLPGRILIEERSIGGVTFSLTSTNGESFSPVLQNTGFNNISDNDEKQNRIYISKFQQPEAVPILQYISAGSENFPIKRIIALRDSVFVLKDDGFFRITGEDVNNFIVSLFDSSATLLANESAVILNNQIFCFTSQGLCTVSDSGLQIISIPIESELLEISSSLYPSFSESTFAISYESDRKYILYTVSEPEDQYATRAFVYNTVTAGFSEWDLTRSSGIVSPYDNKMYSANPDNFTIYKERKNFNRTDYADEEYDVEITSESDHGEIQLVSTSDLEVGYTLKQGGHESVIIEITDSTDIIVADDLNWSVGAAIAYVPIPVELEWVPNSTENPGILKHFSECTIFFEDANFTSMEIGVQSNFNRNFDFVEVSPISSAQWGEFPWGELPWGGYGGGQQPIRTYVPLEKQRASWVNFKVRSEEAFTSFALTGISAQFEPMSSRFR